MNFRTRPEAIEAFGEQVTGLAGDVEAAKRYIEQHLSLEWGIGDDTVIYPNAVHAGNDVKNAVLASLNHLGAYAKRHHGRRHPPGEGGRAVDGRGSGRGALPRGAATRTTGAASRARAISAAAMGRRVGMGITSTRTGARSTRGIRRT